MKYKLVAPQKIEGTILLPTSKSISNRALIISALAKNEKNLKNLSNCDDTVVMQEALSSTLKHINVGAAGTSMRFLTSYLSITNGTHFITGSERMKQRPIGVLVDALRNLGASILYVEKNDFPPLKIEGKLLDGGDLKLRGDVSSQYISALLMIAPTLKKGLRLTLTGKVISCPYINMTLKMLEEFGVKSSWTENVITILPQSLKGKEFEVESDWSAASYWYEILSICRNGVIRLKGLRKNSVQGDSKIAHIFEKFGITTTYENDGVVLSVLHSNYPEELNLNLVECPDMAQTLVATCCALKIPFCFTGLESLKIKETNRILALQTEMKKIGIELTEAEEGSLSWNGISTKSDVAVTVTFDTYEDHRMAMSLAPLSFLHSVTINNPEVVSKSYPKFWEDLEKNGFQFL